MARHKPYLYTIFVIATLLLIWVAYSINQPPKWGGATEDGQWEAAYDYNREPDAPGDWLGVIY
ncbi:hypothetical protein [Halalkalibacterium halodurans]|uniref:hypothetical protein n=1 Tax=Halalkalibacterium halodurans TaxID=86665 RepID=UPI002AA9C4DE|nr:hypothetical protein [Halalkalibacterium halodurans]MDY7223454.1 hypothetical protein [Halalkalibacterium halodurans]MDY7242675.1 hypothetical protein [Halalkalibacterium halodurans]